MEVGMVLYGGQSHHARLRRSAPGLERVCVDRNRFTGGGVTAGIDFGLTPVARVIGEDAAKLSQPAMEYNPRRIARTVSQVLERCAAPSDA
ncbi:predicted protein [Streptomyces iranensis]|uniref:Uncharacterized protein n=1 Tax=Streptomyces iranensis TaxID=576784 RepID=A0A060ZUQ5_9ACTN|nr:predicted protein [Streptomyces iranensis]